jgi:hypothetical protein
MVMEKFNTVHSQHVKKNLLLDGHSHDISEHTQERSPLSAQYVVKNSFRNVP